MCVSTIGRGRDPRHKETAVRVTSHARHAATGTRAFTGKGEDAVRATTRQDHDRDTGDLHRAGLPARMDRAARDAAALGLAGLLVTIVD
jgi:hypothetical protein